MTVSGPVGVHIRYPFHSVADDETWLATAASRHRGRLDDYLMESFPAQRHSRFATDSDAQAFIDELSHSGRWKAGIMRFGPAGG